MSFVLGAFAKLRKATVFFVISAVIPSVCASVRPHVKLGSLQTYFHEICYLSIFRNLSTTFSFNWNLIRVTDTLHEDRCGFVEVCCSFLLRMGNVSDKIVEEIITQTLFFRNSSRWQYNVEECCKTSQATNGNIIGHMCYACWIAKDSDAPLDYVMLTAIPRQELLHQIASLFHL